MFTRLFWKRTAERAVSTLAQAAIPVFGADAVGVLDSGIWAKLGIVGIAGLLSVLKSLVAAQSGDPESPSLVD